MMNLKECFKRIHSFTEPAIKNRKSPLRFQNLQSSEGRHVHFYRTVLNHSVYLYSKFCFYGLPATLSYLISTLLM